MIAEFLLTAANVEYEFKNISIEEAQQDEFKSISPFSKIPVLVCPDGQTIFETVAIVTHLIEKFPQLAPHSSSSERNLLWQYLAMIATSIYAGYHRQFYSHRYAPKDVAEDVGKLAAQDRETANNIFSKTLCNGFIKVLNCRIPLNTVNFFVIISIYLKQPQTFFCKTFPV